MTRDIWRERIVDACKNAGTYNAVFDDVIDALANIMEKRDVAEEQFLESGGEVVIVHTNKAGADNPTKNPALTIWMDLNSQALSYWRDLGLTPAGLKKINETAMQPKKKTGLEAALSALV